MLLFRAAAHPYRCARTQKGEFRETLSLVGLRRRGLVRCRRIGANNWFFRLTGRGEGLVEREPWLPGTEYRPLEEKAF
jgi:hypothetical protein